MIRRRLSLAALAVLGLALAACADTTAPRPRQDGGTPAPRCTVTNGSQICS